MTRSTLVNLYRARWLVHALILSTIAIVCHLAYSSATVGHSLTHGAIGQALVRGHHVADPSDLFLAALMPRLGWPRSETGPKTETIDLLKPGQSFLALDTKAFVDALRQSAIIDRVELGSGPINGKAELRAGA